MLMQPSKPRLLSEIRKERGYTQDALSAILEIHRVTLSKYERGILEVPRSIKFMITSMFCVLADDIIWDIEPKKVKTNLLTEKKP